MEIKSNIVQRHKSFSPDLKIFTILLLISLTILVSFILYLLNSCEKNTVLNITVETADRNFVHFTIHFENKSVTAESVCNTTISNRPKVITTKKPIVWNPV